MGGGDHLGWMLRDQGIGWSGGIRWSKGGQWSHGQRWRLGGQGGVSWSVRCGQSVGGGGGSWEWEG